jgi:hypothetical protein
MSVDDGGQSWDVNLGVALGPGKVWATHARRVAERLALVARDDATTLTGIGTLRCCNCGLAVYESMKLPIRDPQDSVVCPPGPPGHPGPGQPFGHIDTRQAVANGGGGLVLLSNPGENKGGMADGKSAPGAVVVVWGRDWVRVPLEYDLERTGSPLELSDFVACTPPCALRYMYDSPVFPQARVPLLMAQMMWHRHRVEEPTNAAPPANALAYLLDSTPLAAPHASIAPFSSHAPAPSSALATAGGGTSVAAGWSAALIEAAKSGGNTTTTTTPNSTVATRARSERHRCGLAARQFYAILKESCLVGHVRIAPLYAPPMRGEAKAVANRDYRFTQYYMREPTAAQGAAPSASSAAWAAPGAGPPHVGAELPPHLPSCGVRLDANPDADAETDFATDTVHPPELLKLRPLRHQRIPDTPPAPQTHPPPIFPRVAVAVS